MMEPPYYFEPIRKRAAKRWDQLEDDPELAGPWHQLFKQVQSPRHVLSELLQNADDAGATEASVRITDGVFVFSHNGEDFTKEHFASLCRFGYSNKRALHTIGFRGIGFKSTFSLGDTVELRTPTLSIAFHRQRFTEPIWLVPSSSEDHTEIRVAIQDELRQRELEKNLSEWVKSPVSLLFFRHIRRMRIGNTEVSWKNLGVGPVPDTERMTLQDNIEKVFLIARSVDEPFPEDALTEIKQERLLPIDHDLDFPPCKVEIVLNAEGRLFVVLPTGVATTLPFACNAPFLQDPGRLKIKDPEISPTNRWLLNRLGALAASVMLQWLSDESTSVAERCRAYQLLPDVTGNDNSLEGTCAALVKDAFATILHDQSYLLTDDGELHLAQKSVIIPEEIFEVWPAAQAAVLLDNAHRSALSRHASPAHRKRLMQWGGIEEISKQKILSIIQTLHLPKPEHWSQLLKLWAYFAPELTGHRQDANRKSTCILPVQGKEVLYSANEVVRLGEKKLLQSEADWQFLETYLLALNQNWLRFLAEQRRYAEEHKDKALKEEVDAASAVLKSIGFEEPSDVSKVIEHVAAPFFNHQSIELAGCVQFAQIAAKLGAAAGEAFRFVTQDRQLHASKETILFDEDGTLEPLLPAEWYSSHLLHPSYSRTFQSCTLEEWRRWVVSGRAGLHIFVPLLPRQVKIWGDRNVMLELRKRGFTGLPSYAYQTEKYVIEDWDFAEPLWQYWRVLAQEDAKLWGHTAERIFAQPEPFWSKAQTARALQLSTTGKTQPITHAPLTPSWILKLRELPCLPDTRGFYHKPADLLRRTPETESFIDIEPFVHSRFDTEATRPLLKLLGVRDTPTGPERVLDCVRALAKANNPPIHEVEKWYRRLDQMADTCSTTDMQNIRQAFRSEKLILTDNTTWVGASGVFLSSDEEDVPCAAVIRASVRDLTLWRKIGVAERPTVELAIQWLKELPTNQALSQEDLRRVRALLPRHPVRIWEECGHWLNLVGQWVPVDTLRYALTMQVLVPWSHLHEWVKQQTADLQRLSAEITDALPFSDLALLGNCIGERLHRNPLSPGHPERKMWLNHLGAELRRIALDDEADTVRMRTLALKLTETMWQTTAGLELIPYISGMPAGTPRHAEVAWLDKTLYVEDRPSARLARAVSQELGRTFRRPDIIDAIKICFDRSPEFITEYVEENFKLAQYETVKPAVAEDRLSTNGASVADRNKGVSHPPIGTFSVQKGAGQWDDEKAVIVVTRLDDEGEEQKEREEERYDIDEVEIVPPTNHQPSKPAKPTMIERFARRQGFQTDGEERFYHEDGSRIAKSRDNRSLWERRSASGDLVCSYWPKEHCLEREPLQLDADLWWRIEKCPDKYALILSDLQDEPVELRGGRLVGLLADREMTLHPATYRLVLGHGNAE